MSRYKRYERYKDSGVEWIGEIPEHWEVSKLKYLTYCLDGKRIPLSSEQRGEMQGDIPYWGANCIIDYVNDWLIDGEVVLLGEDGAPFFDKYKDVAFYSNGRIWPNNHVHVLRALQSINAKLLTYILNTVDYSNYIKGSTRDKLTQAEMKNIFIQLLPVREQKAIVNFLDQKTNKIDSLIADKEKLIELLQEKRQAIITEAVTKGLNPNVKMKDSGIEWIGEIPEHWSITKMKYLLSPKKYSIKAGPFGSQLKNDDMVSGDVKVYNQKTVLDNDFKSGDYYIENYKYEELRAFEVFSGDLLVTTRGTIGKTAIVPKDAEKGILHPCLIKITLNPDKVLNEYINVVFNNTKIVTNQIMLESNATTIDVIYTDTLKNLVLPIPPLEEQKSIIDFVDAKIGEIDGLISSINNQIQKLKEYRQSLISEAVTGKIDVREFQNKNEVIFRNE